MFFICGNFRLVNISDYRTQASKLYIANRVDNYMESNGFITIKDDKQTFPVKIECRLLNPAKSNLGK